ncbi:hypothetical protein HYS54_02555 [Candidatus Micrarchaeota archaeon]|nr:hypothetical protein [Candidatus Micrarchaeota archaeon]
MIGKEQVAERPLALAELKEILAARKKEAELTFEQKSAYEYASDLVPFSGKKASEAVEKLKAEGVEEKVAVKLVDLLPKTKEELALVFEKTRFDLKEGAVSKILDILAELR